MNKQNSSKKLEPQGPILKLTLADIENNLRKYESIENLENTEKFENLKEFIHKVKSGNGIDGFLSFKFENTASPMLPTEETPELEENFNLPDIKYQNSHFLFNSCPESQYKKSLISSPLRFGLAPLQSIEENASEEVTTEQELVFHQPYKSYQASPRLEFNRGQTLNEKTMGNVLSPRKDNGNAKKTVKNKIKSPYALPMNVKMERLLAIKRPEQTIKFLKNMSLSKRRINFVV